MREWIGFFKNILVVFLSVTVLWPLSGSCAYAAAEIIKTEPVSSGVELITFRYGKAEIYAVKVDLDNKYVQVDTMVGADGTLNKAQNVTDMANRTGAVAGINGGFFQMKNHRPIGLVFHDGEMVASPAQRKDMPGFGITEDNSIIMDVFGFSGQVYSENGSYFPLFGINKPDYLLPTGDSADLNHLNMYTPLWGERTREDISGQSGIVEVVVQNGKVTTVNQDKPGVPIPSNGYVLVGHGEAAEYLQGELLVGSEVEVEYTVAPESVNFRGAVGGNTLLVANGRVAPFTQEISGSLARSAVGIMPDGKTLYLVAAEKSAESIGLTQKEMAQFLVSLGVERAVNLDGGGSTTLAARHLGDFEVSLVNQPQAGWQRSLPDAVGIFSTAPRGDLDGLIVSGPDVVLAGTSRFYSVKGYDEYYNPYKLNQQEIEWYDGAGGSIEKGVFKPAAGGEAEVVAKVGEVQGEKKVKVIGPDELLALNVEPASISVETNSAAVPLKVSVKAKSGEVFELTHEEFQLDLSGEIGSLSGTAFTAGQVPGTGELTVAFQGLTKVIPIAVRTEGSAVVQLLPGNSIPVKPDDTTKLEFPAGAVENPLDIEVKTVDNIEISGYKVLKAVEVLSLDGEVPTLNAPWRLEYVYNMNEVLESPLQVQQETEQVETENIEENSDVDVFLQDKKQASVEDNDDSTNTMQGESSEIMVLYRLPGSNEWIPQPAWADSAVKNNSNTVFSKIKGLGQAAVVVANETVPSFNDLQSHWSEKMVLKMASQGVINGYPDGTFKPDKPVTRAEFVSLLYRGLLWSKVTNQPEFKDQFPDWAADAIAAAVEREAVSGYPDGTFSPDRGISRAEMAVIIDRVLQLPEISEQKEQVFYDEDVIPVWASEHINRVAAAGILNGDNGKFRPDDSAIRAEVAVAISRVLAYWVKH